MDYVDDLQGDFLELEQLDVSDEDRWLLAELAKPYSPLKVRYVLISRGLSSAIKIVAKPETLFPLLVKLDARQQIEQEAHGDMIIRDRVPPLSIPPLERVIHAESRSALAYRYVTGGRVRHLIRRFDTVFQSLNAYRAIQIVDDVFDVILKKCHWLDGQYTMDKVILPDMRYESELEGDQQWTELAYLYEKVQNILSNKKAPHGVVHGDLHAKNILVTRDDAPVLIDFAMVQEGLCVFYDFARFETNLQFQVDGALADKFWRNQELFYGETSLIIPHGNSKLSACVSRIRGNLWQGCSRKSLRMDTADVDAVYRGYLIFCLLRFYSRTSNSMDSRARARNQILGLASGLEI